MSRILEANHPYLLALAFGLVLALAAVFIDASIGDGWSWRMLIPAIVVGVIPVLLISWKKRHGTG